MRKRISNLLLVLVLCLSLTACGSVVSSTGPYDDMYGVTNGAGFEMDGAAIAGAANAQEASGLGGWWSSNKSETQVAVAQPQESYDEPADVETEVGDNNQSGPVIEKDMLVYRGSVYVTTKKYEEAIAGLDKLFETYDCFIESSREFTNYRYDDEISLMTYEATIRVSSKDYESFMGGVSDLGVIESKSSNVENMNMEYSDTVTALRIQKARLDRYLDRLEEETDNEIALQLEDEIASIQIDLQQLEARKSLIETDVAYSYVDLEIREVKAFTSQVTHDDPLHVRTWAEIVNTYYEFTEFMVNVLFFAIHAFPYIVVLVLIIWVARRKLHFKLKLPHIGFKRKKSKKSGGEENEQSSSE